jgi:hypothetical protein
MPLNRLRQERLPQRGQRLNDQRSVAPQLAQAGFGLTTPDTTNCTCCFRA